MGGLKHIIGCTGVAKEDRRSRRLSPEWTQRTRSAARIKQL